MRTYTVTLAAVAEITGSMIVEAENRPAAIATAVADCSEAAWPVDEDGDTIAPANGGAYAYAVQTEDGERTFPPFGTGLSPERAARLACDRLREARDLLKIAGATRSLERVRSALSSAEGAVRAAGYRQAASN